LRHRDSFARRREADMKGSSQNHFADRLRATQRPALRTWRALAAAMTAAVGLCTCEPLLAQELLEELLSPVPCDAEGRRKTLFRWGLDSEAVGGPNLDEPLVTDRPDFTEASVTVGQGVAQLEAGYTYTYNGDDGESVRSHSFGEPLLRVGALADWFEFRVALFPVEQRTRTGGRSHTTAGAEDLYLGVKLALTPQEKWLPEMALMPQMTVPSGSRAFTSNEVLPGVNWLYGWDLNDKLATGGSTQVNGSIDDATGITYAEWAQSWTVGYSLTDKLGMYTEWFAFFPNAADSARTQHYFNGGFTYLANDDVQFDVRAGWGLNDAADDFFAGTGVSIRFR